MSKLLKIVFTCKPCFDPNCRLVPHFQIDNLNKGNGVRTLEEQREKAYLVIGEQG